jgi:hypothetical protein
MPVIKLSQQIIDSHDLQCPSGKKRIEYCDIDLPGLYVLVGSNNTIKSYFLRFRSPDNGRTTHVKLGRTTDIELDEARRRAKTLKAEITLGADPRADEKAKKAILSFHEFFQEHYLPHAKVHNRGWKKKSQMYDLRLNLLAISAWTRSNVTRSSHGTSHCGRMVYHQHIQIASLRFFAIFLTRLLSMRCW